MDLAGGFNISHSEAIKRLYDRSNFPQSILFSFTLCKYLRSQSQGIENVDQFLQQFLNQIPNQFISIFKELKSQANSSTKDKIINSLGQHKIIAERKIKFYEQSIERLESYLECVREYDQQKLIELAEDDIELPQEIIDAFPFDLMKFHGKTLIPNFGKQKIMKQIFEAGDKKLMQSLKRILKESIGEGLIKIDQHRQDAFIEISQKLDLQMLEQLIEKVNADQIRKFRNKLDRTVAQTISITNQNMNMKKNQILEKAQKEVKDVLQKIEKQGLSEKLFYVFRPTVKDDNQHTLENIFNGATKELTKTIKNSKNEINLNSLKQIKQSLNNVSNDKLRQIMKEHYEIACNGLAQKILKQFAKFIEKYNQTLRQVQKQAWEKCQLNLKIDPIDFGILNVVLDGFKTSLSVALGIGIIAGETALRVATVAQGFVFAVGILLVQGSVTHFLRKNQDQKWIPKQNAYKNYLRSLLSTIESIKEQNFTYVLEQSIQKQQRQSLKENEQNFEQIKQKISEVQALKNALDKMRMSQQQHWQRIKKLL